MKNNIKKIIFIVVLEIFCLLIFCMKDLFYIYDKNGGFGFVTNNTTIIYNYSEKNHFLSEDDYIMINKILNIDIFKTSDISFNSTANIAIMRDFKDNKVVGQIMINAYYHSDESLLKFLNNINIKADNINKNYYHSEESYLQNIVVTILNREKKEFVISISEKLPTEYNIKTDILEGKNTNFINYFYSFSEIGRNEIKEKTINLIIDIIIKFFVINILCLIIYLIYKCLKYRKN